MSGDPGRPSGADSGPVLIGGTLAVAFAPACLAGIAAAELLRARRLRWTWAFPPALASLVATLLLASTLGDRLLRLATAIGDGEVTAAAWIHAWWLPWLLACPLVVLGWLRHQERRDRLRGGNAERALASRRGPVDALRDCVASRRPAGRALLTDKGVLLGCDERGRPVRLARPRAHVTVVGASGSGKTTTAKVLLAGQVAAGGGVVVLDGKGGHDLPDHLRRLGEQHGRRVVLWSPLPYGDPGLDTLRMAWNPCSDGTPTEVKDRIAVAEPQTEPYYAAIASRGLQLTARLCHDTGSVDLRAIADWLDDPARLARRLKDAGPEWERDRRWLGGLTDTERSGLRGIATRLVTMTDSEAGPWLLPDHPSGDLLLSEAIRNRWLVCFSLPHGAYPALVPHVGRYLMAALNAVAGRLETAGRPTDCLVLVDELSALDGEQLTAGLERGRSAGLRYILATQSLSNFETSGGPMLAAAALDNAELTIIHRQATPQAAETLASLGGTEETWEHTHQVLDHTGPYGRDDSGQRNRRLVDRYRAHPNHIRELRTGEAIVIQAQPEHRVRRVRVRAEDATCAAAAAVSAN